MIDLRFGRYQDVLADVTDVDLLAVDAPYSGRTHEAYSPRTDVLTACERDAKWAARGGVRSELEYDAWTSREVFAFVDFWAPRTKGWLISLTDHVLAPHWEARMQHHGRYVFAPLPFTETGSRVRMTGDGPSSWTCWLIASRPATKEFAGWGTLPGCYVGPNERKAMMGGKSLTLIRSMIRDYSRPGQTVVDPCAGAGTTLIAAAMEGRRAIGSECLRENFDKAQARIAAGWTAPLFVE